MAVNDMECDCPTEFGFRVDSTQLASALADLTARRALALPLIDEATRRMLCAAASGLPYRPAQPVIGKTGFEVYQDFELCMRFEADSPFRRFAAAFGRLTQRALTRLEPCPLPGPFLYNDLIVQHYPVGSGGITPHRDHVRYRKLVAIVTLAGAARFCICDDRAGRGAREIAAPEGAVLLMLAPGFAGGTARPFHRLDRVTRDRLSFGLRYDTQA